MLFQLQSKQHQLDTQMNHPFIDGNKRTAFAVMDTFITFRTYAFSTKCRAIHELPLRKIKAFTALKA
ncbi:Fic family protein [Nostoc sp.]|uniref:Fic family protein n=1 Tax=Nostoc sp. TaxID=1180 RepID=UPI002FFAB495